MKRSRVRGVRCILALACGLLFVPLVHGQIVSIVLREGDSVDWGPREFQVVSIHGISVNHSGGLCATIGARSGTGEVLSGIWGSINGETLGMMGIASGVPPLLQMEYGRDAGISHTGSVVSPLVAHGGQRPLPQKPGFTG